MRRARSYLGWVLTTVFITYALMVAAVGIVAGG